MATVHVAVSHPLGGQFCGIATAGGIVVARHRLAADELGAMARDGEHVIALRTAATNASHRAKLDYTNAKCIATQRNT